MDLISPAPHNQRHVPGKMVPFTFPPSKFALWNPAPIGESTRSHLSCYRNPRLIITEKTLRLAHRHAKQSRQHHFTCFLIGTLAVDEDDEGILLTIDRFDPGREVAGRLEKIPTAPLPGDFLIPCTFSVWRASSGDIIVHNSEDFNLAFKILLHNLNSQDSLDPSKLLTLRVYISSTENMDNLNFDFHWAAVTVANVLKCTPVNSVPIIPTALARNLNSHMNITQIQGTCKCGYLTMDQTRKLLLVLESDPKAYTLPLIGIWLSGISHIYSPQVWTLSLHYLFNSSVQERVLSESGSFLIVLFSLKHNSPEFYECVPCGGGTDVGFQLLTAKETLHLFNNVEPSDRHPIQFELSSENKNAEMEFFSNILKNFCTSSLSQDSSSKLSISDHDSGVEDDASPRSFPHPHPVSQQITEIQPLVPELSIVFEGTATESVPVSKQAMIMDKKSQPSLNFQPAMVTYPAKHLPGQLQSSDNGKQIFSGCTREPSPRQLPSQSKQKIALLKPCIGGHSSPLLQPSAVGSQAKKSSDSNSPSSLSPPCSGSSPNASSHHLGMLSEKFLSSSDAGQKKELSNNGASAPSFMQHPVHSQSSWHSHALSPPHGKKPLDVRVPVQGLPCCPACVCSCQLHGHLQYSPINVWQGMCLSHTPEIQSGSAQESTKEVLHQNIGTTDPGCHPVCASSSPINPCHHGLMRSSCSDNMSGKVRISPSDPCSSQPHTVCSACVHTSEAKMGSNNEMMKLSSDVYRILTEQDRQIKLLQAQIHRLLEAQTLQTSPTKTIANSSLQSQKQLEFVAMETQSSPVLHMKKSVSIAVSTGASLYLNTPLERNKESIKQDDVEISNEDINISINTEKDRSQTSIASSLKAVDIPSFVDSVHVAGDGPSHSSAGLCGPVATGIAQTSLMSESVSMCLQTRPSGGTDNNLMAVDEQKVENIITALPNVQPSDQKFYQDILGQVNHFLKDSSEESKSSANEDLINNECTASSKTNKIKGDSTTDLVLSDKDSVLQATLKQLKQLGVNFDSPYKTNSAHKVENASIMACINPEAVIPGLNYISFANVGMSGLTPNGVDLSMEANAIALKYLSENQLSQLSLSHSGQKNSVTSSLQTVLHTNTDKTLVGFGLISPSNMSFATKKYMRKYGLLQNCDGSDEEEEQRTDCHKGKENLKPVLHLDFNPVLEGFACWKDFSERTCERQVPVNKINPSTEPSNGHLPHSEAPILRNITNTVLPLRILHQSNEKPVPFLKDLKPKMELLPGKAEFTQHPAEDNMDVPVVPKTPQVPIIDHLNQADNMNSVGTFLDVKQLRQLPKLF